MYLFTYLKKIPFYVYLSSLLISFVPISVLICSYLLTPKDKVFLWELQNDQFTYIANAREIFENGNGFAYANPYDTSLDTPIIYSHLFSLIVGYIWYFFGVPFAISYVALRIIFGVSLGIVLWFFLKEYYEHNPYIRSFYFLLVGGGAIYWVFYLPGFLLRGELKDTYFNGIAEIQFEGLWWFLNIFQNYFYVIEILYHTLFFCTLVLLLKRKLVLSLILFALTLYAHPFTGLQLGLVTVLYVFTLLFPFYNYKEKRGLFIYFCFVLFLFSLFLYYNLVWLKSFYHHAHLMTLWTALPYTLPIYTQLFSYFPWVFLAVGSFVMYFKDLFYSPKWRLLLVMVIVNIFLVNHHYILGISIQPAHFSRGFLYVAILLLSFYYLMHSGILHSLIKRKIIMLFIFSAFFIDNLLFPVVAIVNAQQEPQVVSRDAYEVLKQLDQMPPGQVIFAPGYTIPFLTPVVTKQKAILWHEPHSTLNSKKDLHELLENTGDMAFLERYPYVSVVVVRRSAKLSSEFQRMWSKGFENNAYTVYLKKSE